MPLSEESILNDEDNPAHAEAASADPSAVSNRLGVERENDGPAAAAIAAAQAPPPPPPVRRHSLPASYHLSTFLSFFAHNDTENANSIANVNRPKAKTPPAQPPQKQQGNSIEQQQQQQQQQQQRSNHTPVPCATGQTLVASSVNRHRYGHRHTKSAAVLDQPVIVRTYNPPTSPRPSARAGMTNPAVYEVSL